ncbi:uncharacterized protein DUF4364 [Hydrogenoanaerobacterium saccharovorans]|uniref:DUF4364 domain-containing protein n=1 Tax=Hydrogenoanaerobacterium saccharovorans TaxID=474960 RepID=A0A1H8AM79_9FIRM|nr:DUF4364 family protein [Hydrogenoanaerobacterium saccharovorans]RPF47896.1 uncharacterized protein DUF4364 [Hydrogenoanaerobacterium saccharovorans]SEM71094.1 protein of unknown function [Hydrogenoanaerobacterium saccharovorans]
MELKAFSAGIEPGGLTLAHEIKILVCYLLHNISQKLTLSQINEALLKKGLVNYFELADAMSELLESGHIIICATNEKDEECYELTELGVRTAQEFSDTLPLTVREKALHSAQNLLARQKSAAENIVTVDKVKDGYMVNLIISDIGSDLMNLSLFMPTENEADAVKRQFIRDPLLIYKGMLALLTGDLKTVGELIPTDNAMYDD